MSHTDIPVEKKEKYRWRIRKRETKKNDGNILPNEKLNLSKGRQNGKRQRYHLRPIYSKSDWILTTHITLKHIFHGKSPWAPSKIVNCHYAPSKTVNCHYVPSKTVNCHRVAHAAYAIAAGVPNMYKKINGDVWYITL